MARKQDKQMTALKQLEAAANAAAARYSAAVVEAEKARASYSKAHTAVLQHLDYLARASEKRTEAMTDHELQVRAAFAVFETS